MKNNTVLSLVIPPCFPARGLGSPAISQVILRDNKLYSSEAQGGQATALSALLTVHVSLVAI